jgi:hypothetical protein
MMSQGSRSSLIDDARFYNPGCEAVAYRVSIGAEGRAEITAAFSIVLQRMSQEIRGFRGHP